MEHLSDRRSRLRSIMRIGSLTLVSALVLGWPVGVAADVQPGFYFDPEAAAPGATVAVRSVEVGFSDGATFFLARASADIAGPADSDLIAVAGTITTDDTGDSSFVFAVPAIAPGTYVGYVDDHDGTFGPTNDTLTVLATPRPPATDTIDRPSVPVDRRGDAGILLAAAAVAGGVLGWSRRDPFTRRRRREEP